MLARRSAQRRRIVLTDQSNELAVNVIDANWRKWRMCWCLVRGRLVKTVTLPDGTTKDFPILNARVTIYEVDALPWIIATLPEEIVWRVRDELLHERLEPRPQVAKFPFPPPPPPEIGLGRRFESSPAAMASRMQTRKLDDTVSVAARPVAETAALQTIAAASSTVELRRALTDSIALVRAYVCL